MLNTRIKYKIYILKNVYGYIHIYGYNMNNVLYANTTFDYRHFHFIIILL